MTNNKNFPKSHEYLLKINNYVPGKSKINNSPEKIIKLSSKERYFTLPIGRYLIL
jgi:hypothetical protein